MWQPEIRCACLKRVMTVWQRILMELTCLWKKPCGIWFHPLTNDCLRSATVPWWRGACPMPDEGILSLFLFPWSIPSCTNPSESHLQCANCQLMKIQEAEPRFGDILKLMFWNWTLRKKLNDPNQKLWLFLNLSLKNSGEIDRKTKKSAKPPFDYFLVCNYCCLLNPDKKRVTFCLTYHCDEKLLPFLSRYNLADLFPGRHMFPQMQFFCFI